MEISTVWRYLSVMCNLYSMTRAPEAVRRLFRVPHNRSGEIKPQTAIFPAYDAPVVRPTADGERELVTMSWGFVLLQAGKAPRRVTNVRDEGAHEQLLARVVFRSGAV